MHASHLLKYLFLARQIKNSSAGKGLDTAFLSLVQRAVQQQVARAGRSRGAGEQHLHKLLQLLNPADDQAQRLV